MYFSKCTAGCMVCTPKDCDVCELSEWSEWSKCTHKCKGISKRFRNYYGENCKKNETLEETQQCNDCSCVVDGISYPENSTFGNPNNKCEVCKCVEGFTKCYPNCNSTETKESCQDKSNDEYIFTWVEPKAGECCGSCNKTKSMFKFDSNEMISNNNWKTKPMPFFKPKGAQDKCDVVRSKPRYHQVANCISVKPVVDSFCGGSCYSHESNKLKFRKVIIGEKECKCCGAEKVEEEPIEMKCKTASGYEYETATLVKILSCKCHQCGARAREELISTSVSEPFVGLQAPTFIR